MGILVAPCVFLQSSFQAALCLLSSRRIGNGKAFKARQRTLNIISGAGGVVNRLCFAVVFPLAILANFLLEVSDLSEEAEDACVRFVVLVDEGGSPLVSKLESLCLVLIVSRFDVGETDRALVPILNDGIVPDQVVPVVWLIKLVEFSSNASHDQASEDGVS